MLRSLLIYDSRDFVTASATAAMTAIGAGRKAVAAWRAAPAAPDAALASMRAAGIDEWRSRVLVWDAARTPDAAYRLLTTTELAMIGSADPLAAMWSGPSMSLDGCVCRIGAGRYTPMIAAGHIGLTTGVVPDLSLRIGEHLTALGLPLPLVPALLPYATQDWLDHLQQLFPSDWHAITSWPSTVPLARVEAYLLALIADRALLPPK